MTRFIVAFGIAFAGYVLLWWLSPAREISTRIEIGATSEQVWSVLIDGKAYPDWNPFIRRLDGKIAPGRRLDIALAPKGHGSIHFSPIVTRFDPRRELCWLGRLPVPGLLDGEHYFLLAPTTDGRTMLVHGERFTGILPWIFGIEVFRQDFEAVNSALRARAEIGSEKLHHTKREQS
jgi:hypothetical protein